MTIDIDDAISALLAYRQADMEGVEVLTSRQAIHEVADELRRMRTLAQQAAKPVAYRYQRKEGWGDIWRTETFYPTFEDPGLWTVQPLYIVARPTDALPKEDYVVAWRWKVSPDQINWQYSEAPPAKHPVYNLELLYSEGPHQRSSAANVELLIENLAQTTVDYERAERSDAKYYRQELEKAKQAIRDAITGAVPQRVPTREQIARAVYDVANRWIAPNFPKGHKLRTFDEIDGQDLALHLDYADAVLALSFRPCPGCDGYECKNECRYPGAVGGLK